MQVAVYGNGCDSALHLAIKHGHTKVAMALIENGANVDFS
jgi:ankyrin repeat protein